MDWSIASFLDVGRNPNDVYTGSYHLHRGESPMIPASKEETAQLSMIPFVFVLFSLFMITTAVNLQVLFIRNMQSRQDTERRQQPLCLLRMFSD